MMMVRLIDWEETDVVIFGPENLIQRFICLYGREQQPTTSNNRFQQDFYFVWKFLSNGI